MHCQVHVHLGMCERHAVVGSGNRREFSHYPGELGRAGNVLTLSLLLHRRDTDCSHLKFSKEQRALHLPPPTPTRGQRPPWDSAAPQPSQPCPSVSAGGTCFLPVGRVRTRANVKVLRRQSPSESFASLPFKDSACCHNPARVSGTWLTGRG